jgi:hypothetical protein
MRLREAMTADIRRSWLRHWHSVIDDVIGADPAFDFEAAYQDPYGDFRMHFVTWDLPDESLRRCFEVLPRGGEICTRAIEMRRLYRGEKSSIPQQEALELFQRGLIGFAQFVESEDLRKPIRVTTVTRAELLSPCADRVAVILEAVDWSACFAAENRGVGSFLLETLYRLAYSYDVADYVRWPLSPDPQSVDPFRVFALLALSDKYYPMLDADGPVLFVVAD